MKISKGAVRLDKTEQRKMSEMAALLRILASASSRRGEPTDAVAPVSLMCESAATFLDRILVAFTVGNEAETVLPKPPQPSPSLPFSAEEPPEQVAGSVCIDFTT